MHARSRIGTRWCPAPNGAGRTRVSNWHAESPLLLKATRRKEPEPWPELTGAARISVTAGAAGPIGGDSYRLEIEVGAGSGLVLNDISPTLLLPGSDGAASSYTVVAGVAKDATLIWLAAPLIAARGCNHHHQISVDLHPTARLMMRDELLLGRYGETSGAVRQRITVRRGGQSLHRQDLSVGPGAPGQHGPAVLGGARAAGSVFIVDPDWERTPPVQFVVSARCAGLPLTGPALLVTAVADDNVALRDDLNAGLARLGPPWQPK